MRHCPYTRPSADQPGTLAQQLHAVLVYLRDPARADDPPAAWQRARAAAMPHAGGAAP